MRTRASRIEIRRGRPELFNARASCCWMAYTFFGLGFLVMLSSLKTLIDKPRAKPHSWLICSDQADHSEAFKANTLRVSTPRSGRTGNHIRFYRWAITEALILGCHVILPKQISTLDVFSNCSALFNTRAKVSASCGERKLITDYDGLSEFRTAPAHVRSVVHDLLRSYTSSTATKNVRYAYGKLCPNREYSMIHIRSGDTYKGKFSSAGNWEPAKTYSQYAPFPTSYYVVAFSVLLRLNQQIVVVCEDAQSLACSFFQTIQILYPDVLQVRLSDSLLFDLQDFTCASHVVASRGSFHECFNLHESQVLHDFVDHKAITCTGNKIYHYARDQNNSYAQNVTSKWMNTDLQRWLVNQPLDVQYVDCRRLR